MTTTNSEIEAFYEKNKEKSIEELLEILAEGLLEADPEGLKAGMRKAGYDVDNMKCFEDVKDDETTNDKST